MPSAIYGMRRENSVFSILQMIWYKLKWSHYKVNFGKSSNVPSSRASEMPSAIYGMRRENSVFSILQMIWYKLKWSHYVVNRGYTDKDAVLMKAKKHSSALKFLSEDLKGDRDVVLASVRNKGSALKYASTLLRSDREIVLAAVSAYGGALYYASETLKEDKEIALAAVQNYGCSISFSSDSLKDDKDIVLAAVKQNVRAFDYASDRLKTDRDVAKAKNDKLRTAAKSQTTKSVSKKSGIKMILENVLSLHTTFCQASIVSIIMDLYHKLRLSHNNGNIEVLDGNFINKENEKKVSHKSSIGMIILVSIIMSLHHKLRLLHDNGNVEELNGNVGVKNEKGKKVFHKSGIGMIILVSIIISLYHKLRLSHDNGDVEKSDVKVEDKKEKGKKVFHKSGIGMIIESVLSLHRTFCKVSIVSVLISLYRSLSWQSVLSLHRFACENSVFSIIWSVCSCNFVTEDDPIDHSFQTAPVTASMFSILHHERHKHSIGKTIHSICHDASTFSILHYEWHKRGIGNSIHNICPDASIFSILHHNFQKHITANRETIRSLYHCASIFSVLHHNWHKRRNRNNENVQKKASSDIDIPYVEIPVCMAPVEDNIHNNDMHMHNAIKGITNTIHNLCHYASIFSILHHNWHKRFVGPILTNCLAARNSLYKVLAYIILPIQNVCHRASVFSVLRHKCQYFSHICVIKSIIHSYFIRMNTIMNLLSVFTFVTVTFMTKVLAIRNIFCQALVNYILRHKWQKLKWIQYRGLP